MSKKIFSALLALVLLIGLMPVSAIPAFAAPNSCGKDLTWTVDGSSLIIEGKGDLALTGGVAPWDAQKNNIEQIRFKMDGPISIPAGTFSSKTSDYVNLKSVHVSDLTYWLQSSFEGVNPLAAGSRAHNFYLNDTILGMDQAMEIPAGIISIPANAFNGSTIKQIKMPMSLQTIGAEAFANCYQLQDFSLFGNVTTIGARAFAGCKGLTKVVLPDSLTTLGEKAFRNCDGLTSVSGASYLKEFGSHIFEGCEKLNSVQLPKELTAISDNAFAGCVKLQKVEIPEKVETIGGGAFAFSGLTGISVPKSVKKIGADAFFGCENLGYIDVSSIEAWCAMEISGVNPLDTAKNLRIAGKEIKELSLPDTLAAVPAGRFANTKNITKVVIPNSVQIIKQSAFAGCENITELVLGDSVEKIEANAFAGCGRLKTVTVDEKQWESRLAVLSGNDYLVEAYKNGHKSPVTPVGPSGSKFADISDKLVDLVAGMHTFRATSYEYPADSGKYLIGYGTPSVKNAAITEPEAKTMLKEESLAVAAGAVADKFPALASEANREKREALASYCFRNGYDWMNNANHPLYKAVSGTVSEFELLEAICFGAQPGTSAFTSALCEGNLYVNGKYTNAVPDNYGYVILDPNGGKAAGGIYVVYNKDNAATEILVKYNPTMFRNKFLGWFTSKENGTLVNHLDPSMDGRTIYAHWQHDETAVPEGKPVSYQLPTVLVADSCLDAATKRVRVYEAPDVSSQHIQTLENNTLMNIVAEYRDAAGNLWVHIQNSGWVSLGTSPMSAVETCTVKLGKNQRLNVYEHIEPNTIGTKRVASVRNDNKVFVIGRQKIEEKNWGRVWFLDSEDNIYKTGWIDLTHVSIDQLPEAEDAKKPISQGEITGTENVNVREKPDVYGKFVCKLARGKKVNIYETAVTNNVKWALTDEGWVCMQYVKEIAQKPENGGSSVPETGNAGSDTNTTPLAKGQVIGNLVLNVRSAPGAQNKKVATLTGGTRLSIFQTKMFNGAQWGRMEKGWVCMTYIRLDGGVIIQGNGSAENEKAPAPLGQARVVNCSTHVNVRANATPQSALQGTYRLNTVVDLLEHTENNGFDWYRTERGWVCGTYLQKLSAPAVKPSNPVVPKPGTPVVPGTPSAAITGTITGSDNVNVRSDAGISNAKVTTLRSGSKVNIKGNKIVDGVTWYQIDQGWVSGEYVLVGGGEITGGNGTPVIGGTTQTGDGKYATGTVAQAGTQVRAGAGYGYKDIKTLSAGTKVTIYEQQLLDGVAWGRISNTGWVNLAYITLNSTGITGTGTVGTIARCGHAVNVRRSPSVDSARMATLLLGATVEILETKDLGNDEIWGRTPQGWVNMHYVQMTGEIPAPPLNPETGKPVDPSAPTVPSNPVNPEKPKPADQGIPFVMKGKTTAETDLQIIPGVLGEYDAKIAGDRAVSITKLDSVDDKLWGLVEGGWVDMNFVTLSNYVVSNNAQLIWQDANTDHAVGALNKGDVKNIQELKMDEAKKVWGRIESDQWIELTQITALGSYSTSFYVKTTSIASDVKVYTYSDSTSEVMPEKLLGGTVVTVTGLAYDAHDNSRIMLKIAEGWIMASDVNMAISAKVTPEMLVTWNSQERTSPKGFKHCGDTVVISAFGINSSGIPMGQIDADEWVELAAVVTP